MIVSGEHLAAARRRSAVSQKELASRLGVSLWAVDQLERNRGDATTHRRALAALGLAETAVAPPTAISGNTPQVLQAGTVAYANAGRDLVIGSIAALVLIRFFTEVVPVLPRAANFVDVPIVVALGVAAATRRGPKFRAPPLSFALPASLFLLLCAVSVVTNPTRVAAGPALVFIFGFVAPIAVYAAVFRLWTPGQASTLSRVLVTLGVVQLFVVFAIDLPLFLSSDNPDVVSGTFGTNAYQLVFFLLVFTALLAGIYVVEKKRLAARLAPALLGLTLGAILLAQYRALLVTTAVSILLIGILLGSRGRGLLVGLFIFASFVFGVSYVASNYPGLKFASTIATLGERPGYYISEKLRSSATFVRLYDDEPLAILTGTGPGTFSSRGWQTFANAGSASQSNVAGRYVSAVTGGNAYRTDVSDEYVQPQLRGGAVIEGSRALTTPYSSYSSLLAEVGLLGFLLMVGIYVRALAYAWSGTVRELKNSQRGDPLPALLLASTIAFSVLLQMAFLENWLEVTRVTFIAWALLAVTVKEVHSRNQSLA